MLLGGPSEDSPPSSRIFFTCLVQDEVGLMATHTHKEAHVGGLKDELRTEDQGDIEVFLFLSFYGSFVSIDVAAISFLQEEYHWGICGIQERSLNGFEALGFEEFLVSIQKPEESSVLILHLSQHKEDLSLKAIS